MEVTLRDVLYLLALLSSVGGLYVGIVTRLTRLEAIVHRVERVEGTVDELIKADAQIQAEIAGMRGGGLRDRRVSG